MNHTRRHVTFPLHHRKGRRVSLNINFFDRYYGICPPGCVFLAAFVLSFLPSNRKRMGFWGKLMLLSFLLVLANFER